MTVFPVVTGFLYRLRTQTIIRQKVYSQDLRSLWVYKLSVLCFSLSSILLRHQNKTMKGWDFAQSHADFLVFFFSLLDHGSSHTTCTNGNDDLWSFCARFRQRPEVEFSIWFSTYHHQSALLRLGIAIAVRQVKPALLWKKRKEIFKNYWRS